jgi:hypothetical protein
MLLAARQKQSIGRLHRSCPICESPELRYEFIVDRQPVCSCRKCSLLFLNPQPELGPNDASEAVSGTQDADQDRHQEVRTVNATANLKQLFHYTGRQVGRLLIIGADALLETEARRQGLEVMRFTNTEVDNGALTSLS